MTHAISRRLFIALAGTAFINTRFSLADTAVPAALDHILLGCSDLDGGIAFVERHIGVRAVFGGVHPGRGTRNALLSLGEKHYLEVIAPDPQQPDAPDTRGLRALTEPRLVGWAAHPENMDAFAARLRQQNIVFEGPTPGSRKRPDGRLLQWKTLQLKNDYDGLLPFFIEWAAATTHPSADAPAGCRIAAFSLASPNDSEVRRVCSQLDLDVLIERSDQPQLRASISGTNQRILQLTS
jgi:catechol 2,3-dioxygenase-like lactoylglutathione lyase family enzyme